MKVGYSRVIKEKEYDVLKVVGEPAPWIAPRMAIFRDYLQKYEMLKDMDDDFYNKLQYGASVNDSIQKGEFIRPDNSVVRLLWQGKLIRGEEELKVHSLIPNDQPVENVQCYCDTPCECPGLIVIELDAAKLKVCLDA